MRLLVGEAEDDLRASVDAFAVLDDVIERRLKRRLTTVVDSLGTDAQRRDKWRVLAAANAMPCVAVVFDVSPAQLRRQNRARAKRVPDAVLAHQIAEWPQQRAAVIAEAFDAVHVADSSHEATLVQPTMIRRGRSGAPSAGNATAAHPQTIVDVHMHDRRRPSVRFGLQVPQ